MADYWRYQDRLSSGQLLTKRPRAELDDVLPYGSAGYGRGDLRYDERDARLLDYGLDYGKTGAAFGSVGSTSADISGLGDGSLLGAGRVPGLGLSGLEDPRLSGVDSGLLKGASMGLNGARSDILSRQDVPGVRPGLQPLPSDTAPTLFVEGLPIGCTRREAAHIFRPFRGFKEVRVAQKKLRRAGGEKVVLCFVEFEDVYCAAKALEALQGYKLDEDDRDSEPLQLRFAREGAPRGLGPFGSKLKRKKRPKARSKSCPDRNKYRP